MSIEGSYKGFLSKVPVRVPTWVRARVPLRLPLRVPSRVFLHRFLCKVPIPKPENVLGLRFGVYGPDRSISGLSCSGSKRSADSFLAWAGGADLSGSGEAA